MKKIQNPKISYIFSKTSVLFVICDKRGSYNDVEILTILGLINNINE